MSTSTSLPPAPIEDEEDSEEVALERRTKRREDRPSRPDQIPDSSLIPTTSMAKERQTVDDPKPMESFNPLGNAGQENEAGTAVTKVNPSKIARKFSLYARNSLISVNDHFLTNRRTFPCPRQALWVPV